MCWATAKAVESTIVYGQATPRNFHGTPYGYFLLVSYRLLPLLYEKFVFPLNFFSEEENSLFGRYDGSGNCFDTSRNLLWYEVYVPLAVNFDVICEG